MGKPTSKKAAAPKKAASAIPPQAKNVNVVECNTLNVLPDHRQEVMNALKGLRQAGKLEKSQDSYEIKLESGEILKGRVVVDTIPANPKTKQPGQVLIHFEQL